MRTIQPPGRHWRYFQTESPHTRTPEYPPHSPDTPLTRPLFSCLRTAHPGSYALNSMRLEKGYHACGADFETEYTLFDAGLGNFAKTTKASFIGRDAVLKQQKH